MTGDATREREQWWSSKSRGWGWEVVLGLLSSTYLGPVDRSRGKHACSKFPCLLAYTREYAVCNGDLAFENLTGLDHDRATPNTEWMRPRHEATQPVDARPWDGCLPCPVCRMGR